MSKGQFQTKPISGRKAQESPTVSEKAKDFVVIDLDTDSIHNFIIIDPPESSQKAPSSAGISREDKSSSSNNIISVDDDDDDNSSDDVSSEHGNVGNFVELGGEKSCEIDGSESDCDLVEDDSGKIREEWVKASLRKRVFEDVFEVDSDDDHPSGSGSNVDFQDNVVKNEMENLSSSTSPADIIIDDDARYAKGEKLHWEPSSIGIHIENEEVSFFNIPDSDDMDIDGNNVGPDDDPAHPEETLPSHGGDNLGTTVGPTCSRASFGKVGLESDETCTDNHGEGSCSAPNKKKSFVIVSGVDSSSDEDGRADDQKNIIEDREMLKKTEEYKRATEEEWASRRQQLQIQADEAQRLRKRKKAETKRLLDMERRQKQRVEEMREAQKKDEETINLKERLRVEVRRDLGKLESICSDMASLLRGLGINVRGSPFHSSSDVNAAYKQALLRFHPDRASRTDIRHQVEAEEKFKLVSRAKERFSLSV